MAQYTGTEELPPTPYEQMQERDRITIGQNERRERIRLRRENQKAGHSEPKPGDVIHVQLDNTVRNRTRAGLRFERSIRRTVRVVDAEGAELEAMQKNGADVVDVLGAERILEDQALHVYKTAAEDLDLADLQAKNAALEEENRLMRAEHEALKRKVREARQGAAPSETGAPNRLAAARAAGGSESAPEFGSTGKTETKPTK